MKAVGLAIAFLALALGCEPAEPPTRPVTVRDSAGIELVTNSGPDVPLEVTEVLRVGVLDGDPTLQFDQVNALAVDSVGGFWVTDSYEAVRHFDSAGSYVGSVGGRGEGPGEASYYQGVGRRPLRPGWGPGETPIVRPRGHSAG